MKLFVTGAAGYIGSTFCYEALKRGYEVVGIDNFSNSTRKNINILEDTYADKFKFYEADLLDDCLISFFKNFNKSDAVVHFAALKSVPESQKKPDLYHKNNVEGTRKLVACMIERSVEKLIFSSSAAVYGNHENQPIPECAELCPESNYAITKKKAEEVIKEATGIKGLKAISLRYFNPIGSHKDKIIFEDYKMPSSNIISMIINVALSNIKEIEIFGNDYPTKDGTGERDYIHIEDIVEGHFKALQKLEKNLFDYDVYNLGTGTSISVIELVKTFEKVNNMRIDYKFSDRREGDLAKCYASPKKAFADLDWFARYDLERMCKDAWGAVKK